MFNSFKHTDGITTQKTVSTTYPTLLDCFTNITNFAALYFDRDLQLRYANPAAIKYFSLPMNSIGKITAGLLLKRYQSSLTLNQVIQELTISKNVQIQFKAIPSIKNNDHILFTISQETENQTGSGFILLSDLTAALNTSEQQQQKLLSLASSRLEAP